MDQVQKTCCNCKISQPITEFGKLKATKDGHRYDCKSCRKAYRLQNKEKIKDKNTAYHNKNKDVVNTKHKIRWNENKDRYNEQRKEYRQRSEIKEHIRIKNSEYLPIKRPKSKRDDKQI